MLQHHIYIISRWQEDGDNPKVINVQFIEHYMNKSENLSDSLVPKTPQPSHQLKEQVMKEAQ